VTFDAGQTLVDLDLDFLARRLVERDAYVEPHALAAAAPAAWRVYDEVVVRGGDNAWQAFMRALLAGAGCGSSIDELAGWLWREQPRRNLWRKPIAGMVALARRVRAAGARVGVLSNSEGRLEELLDEIGVGDAFETVIDSGRVGVEKPDPRIFGLVLDRLQVAAGSLCVHIGDSWAADIEGALAAGWRAVWFRSRPSVRDPEHITHDRVAIAHDADGVLAALRAFGVVVD
jgi:putative hydrolase of the HAD superfamily